ncbi:MAG: hypothetical protein ACON5F_09035 [Jejuia sp.]
MKRLPVHVLILLILFTTACKKSFDKVGLAKQYYEVLNTANYDKAKELIADSLLTTEGDYEMVFSQRDYINLLKWDAVFEPEYELINIEEDQGFIKTIVSQTNKRILFLHESPIVFNQIIRFENDNISSVETPSYVIFNDSIFSSNREKLLKWIKQNHPEMKSFIYDQTKKGGQEYLNAINLYKDAN